MRKLPLIALCFFYFCGSAFAQVKGTAVCPSISLNGPARMVDAGATAVFAVNISVSIDQKITYQWTVSEGTIEVGQGSPAISVRTSNNLNGGTISATVSIGGLPQGCQNQATETAAFGPTCRLPVRIDDYGKLAFREEKARLDSIATQLNANPQSGALFIIYVTKKETDSVIKNHVNQIKSYFANRPGITADRLKFIFAEKDLSETIIYLVPPEAMKEFADGVSMAEKLRPIK